MLLSATTTGVGKAHKDATVIALVSHPLDQATLLDPVDEFRGRRFTRAHVLDEFAER
jgi:hypothetical protein